MKAKVLWFRYDDGSGGKAVRVYMEQHFDQAEKDLEIMCEYAADDKNWRLDDCDLYAGNSIRVIYSSQ